MLCIESKLFQRFFDILRFMVNYQNQFFKFQDLPNKGAYTWTFPSIPYLKNGEPPKDGKL